MLEPQGLEWVLSMGQVLPPLAPRMGASYLSDAVSGPSQLCLSQLSAIFSQDSPLPCLELYCGASRAKAGTWLMQGLGWSWETGQSPMQIQSAFTALFWE